MKKRINNQIIVVLFFLVGIMGFGNQALAANCGDTNSDGVTDTPCACGNTVVGTIGYTYQLTGNLTCTTGHGLVVGANGITIDGGNYTITGSGGASGYLGIDNSDGYDNITIKNLNIINFHRGIYFSNVSGSTIIENVIANSNAIGIHLSSSSSNNLTSNTVHSNSDNGIRLSSSSSSNTLNNNTVNSNNEFGICLFSSSSNNLNNNIISKNSKDLFDDGSNTYSSNQFNHNYNMIGRMLTFTDITRTKNLNDTVSFTVTAKKADGTVCANCATITTSPSEASLTYSDNGSGVVTGSFIATNPGTYSLIVAITDSDNNIAKRNYLFFVGNTASQTTKYYLRGINPTHGQPAGSDAKSLLSAAPTITEEWSCAIWVQNSPDEIPDYPLANLSSIDTYTWYKQSSLQVAFIGIQRYVTFDGIIDFYSSPIPYAENYTWVNRNFPDLNWGMDYPHSWYWLSLKLLGVSANPHWTTFPSPEYQNQPSYADFTYSYTTTPAIKSISDEDILVLSATELTDDADNATIVLENPTSSTISTNIVLNDYKRPFQNYTTTISSDGTATIAANNISAGQTATLNSVNMEIIPNLGSVAVFVAVWGTTGEYSRMWTETAEEGIVAQHRIGDLAPNNYYSVTKDGVSLGLYLSDNSGQITFTCPAGSSFTIVALNTVFQLGDDEESENHCFIATACFGTPMAEEVRVLRSFRNKYLLTNPIGQVFVTTYYKTSSSAANFISEHPFLKNIAREMLKPLIWFSERITE